MSSDEQIPAVADVESAKKSDVTSTAGEPSVEKVNDDEQVPQLDEKSTTEKEEEGEGEDNKSEAKVDATEENNNDAKINNNKRDIDEVDKHDEKKNGHPEEDDEEAVVSTTTNKKIKIIDPLTNENGGDIDETSSTSAKVPNEELTIV
jgi:hypothetical protein